MLTTIIHPSLTLSIIELYVSYRWTSHLRPRGPLFFLLTVPSLSHALWIAYAHNITAILVKFSHLYGTYSWLSPAGGGGGRAIGEEEYSVFFTPKQKVLTEDDIWVIKGKWSEDLLQPELFPYQRLHFLFFSKTEVLGLLSIYSFL